MASRYAKASAGLASAMTVWLVAPPAWAGFVVLDGTDSNEHGSASGGVNRNGWLYMEGVVRALAPGAGNGNRNVVTLGTTNGSTARNAIISAFARSGLPESGWTLVHLDGAADLGAYLDGQTRGGVSLATTGMLYIPTAGLTSGDLASAELAAINAPGRAVAIANFVGGNGDASRGGSLFAQGETGTGAYSWLSTLVPGIVSTDVGGGGVGTNITLTPDGQAAFPGLSNAQLAGADPWHNHFSGSFGALSIFGTAMQGTATRNILLGSTRKLTDRGPMVDSAERTVTVGSTLNYHFTAFDPDGDPLTWALVSFTGPAAPLVAPTFDPATQQFVWVTTGSVPGDYVAHVRATDPSGLTDIGALTIHVVPEPASAAGLAVAGILALRRR